MSHPARRRPVATKSRANYNSHVAGQLYLSLWFPNFRFASLPAATLSVLQQFPFSPARPGIRAAIAYPLNWGEPHVYQRIWEADEISVESPEALQGQLERAISEATEMLHEDYAYEFEVNWDLWMPKFGGTHEGANNSGTSTEMDDGEVEDSDEPDDQSTWVRKPSLVRVTALGPDFEDAAFEQMGQIRLDLGHDSLFLQPEIPLGPADLQHIQQNIAMLVDLTARIEKNCGVSSRLLWSDDDSNLAQKLLERLQKLN